MKLSNLKNRLMTKYVTTGLFLASELVKLAKKIVEHILKMQGINLNTQPGAARQKLLNDTFNVFHEESYDADFDFSLANKIRSNKVKFGQDAHQTEFESIKNDTLKDVGTVPLAVDFCFDDTMPRKEIPEIILEMMRSEKDYRGPLPRPQKYYDPASPSCFKRTVQNKVR